MDSRHVRMCPCKDVIALLEGVLDALGLLGCQEGANMCEVSVFFLRFGLSARGPLSRDLCPSGSVIAIG